MIRKWDTGNKELNRKCIEEVITRIQEIDNPETVGVIAAQDIIDIVLINMGPEIYNKAINDTSKLVRDKLEEIEYGTEALIQS
jgi:uncharacterized protein (DUF2164 family)